MSPGSVSPSLILRGGIIGLTLAFHFFGGTVNSLRAKAVLLLPVSSPLPTKSKAGVVCMFPSSCYGRASHRSQWETGCLYLPPPPSISAQDALKFFSTEILRTQRGYVDHLPGDEHGGGIPGKRKPLFWPQSMAKQC